MGDSPAVARLEKIYLRPSARTPVRDIAEARAFPGAGLEGDHAGGGNRQVTLMAAESWEAACRELGRDGLAASGRRANLLLRGLDLGATVGQVIAIGDVRIRVVAELRPCRLMDDFAPGLQQALDPKMRGGVYGRVTVGGALRIGAEARVEDAEPAVAQLELEATR